MQLYKKNQIIKLEIIDISKDGLGIAKIDSQVFFVKNAIVGDVVNAIITKTTSSIIYAKVVEVIEKSQYRVESKCAVSNSCGGCQLLNIDYQKQLEIKKNFVLRNLNKIGRFDSEYLENRYDEIISMDKPHRYRNKLQVPFEIKNGEIVYGFYAERTHHIVECDYCITGFEGSDKILKIIKTAIDKFKISIYDEKTCSGIFREVMLRMANEMQEMSITYILNDKDYVKNIELYKSFNQYIIDSIKSNMKIEITSSININTKNTNVILGNKTIVLNGNGYIKDCISNIKYHISPESFYQVNMKMTQKLYDKVLEYGEFKGSENVLDLYCGIGTISLYIADKVKSVTGIEVVEKAVDNAKDNAQLNNIVNAKFICADAEALSNSIELKEKRFDTVIVDPPRKGLDSNTIDFIKKLKPETLIYVSCDSATLARDLNIVCGDGEYELSKFSNVDMFPHTMHIETVAKILRVDR